MCWTKGGSAPLLDWLSQLLAIVRAEGTATGTQVDRDSKLDRKEAEETSLGEIVRPHLGQGEWQF